MENESSPPKDLKLLETQNIFRLALHVSFFLFPVVHSPKESVLKLNKTNSITSCSSADSDSEDESSKVKQA